MSDEDVMDFSSAKSSSDTSDSESGVEKIKEKGPNAQKKKKSQQSGKKTTKSKFNVFFEIVSKDKDTFGSCKLCKGSKKVEIKMKNRNTSGLKKHLLSVHKNEAKKLFPRDQVTPHVPNFFKCTGQGAQRNKDFTTATVDWITKKYLPFSFSDDQETQDYFRTICPNLKFPKRFTLRRQVQARFEKLQTCVKDQLQKCTSKMSFTIDGWTSIAGRTFYGVTVHFIDNEWNYQSMVLDFVPSHGRHTGEYIARIFHRSLGEFNIENKVQGITVDNASANTKFTTELQKLLPDFDSEDQHFRCMAHILNLGVQDLLKSLTLLSDNDREEENNSADKDEDDLDHLPQIHDTTTAIMKLRSIFSKIKRSEVLSNKFRSACETAGVPITLSPMLDCPTRWGSTHDMLGVALKLKGGIITLCGIIPELNNFRIFEGEWLIFEKIYKFLLNFKILTTKLGGDKYVTLPLVIVSFNLLLDKVKSTIKQLDEKIDHTGVDERLIVGFQAARDKMLKHYKMTNWIYCTTLILDPRHKAETFDLTSWGTDIKYESLRKFKAIYGEYRNREPVPELPVQECQDCQDSDKEDIIDFNTLYSAPSAATASQASRRELEEYLSQPRAAGTEDILQWWRQHQLQFPILARMARDFLSIPATSVPAERLFPKASLVIRKHRNRLNNESARWLLCINSWATKTQ